MTDARFFDDLPRDVAVQISSLLAFEDLRSVVDVCSATRRSFFRDAFLRKVQLRVPPDDTLAAQLMDSLGDSSVRSVAIAYSSHLPLVGRTLGDTIETLRFRAIGGWTRSFDLFVRLRSLDLSNSAIIDVSPISALTQLTQLDLSFTGVVDISPLQPLTMLEILSLESTLVDSIEVVEFMPELVTLNLNRMASLHDLAPTKSLKKLTTLGIRGMRLHELHSLAAVASTLTTLDAEDLKYLGMAVTPPNGHDLLSIFEKMRDLVDATSD